MKRFGGLCENRCEHIIIIIIIIIIKIIQIVQ